MKKLVTITLIMTLVIASLISLKSISFADETERLAPAENGYIEVDRWTRIYNAQDPEGVSEYNNTAVYDEETNTLTLNNYNGGFIEIYNMGDINIKLIGSNEISAYSTSEIATGLFIEEERTTNVKIYGDDSENISASSLCQRYSCSIKCNGNLTFENCSVDGGPIYSANNITVNNSIINASIIYCDSLVENNAMINVHDSVNVDNEDGTTKSYGIYTVNGGITINTGLIRIQNTDQHYLEPAMTKSPDDMRKVYIYGEECEFIPTNVAPTYGAKQIYKIGEWNEKALINDAGYGFETLILTEEEEVEYIRATRIDVINITLPVAGETPTVEGLEMSRDSETINIDNCYWFEEGKPGVPVTKFEGGNRYGLYVEISLPNDYTEAPILFEENDADDYEFDGNLLIVSGVKYYYCETTGDDDPVVVNPIVPQEEPTTPTNPTDGQMGNQQKLHNPVTGDKVQKYFSFGGIGALMLTIAVAFGKRYGTKKSKIQF
jgi:hypothetical protein